VKVATALPETELLDESALKIRKHKHRTYVPGQWNRMQFHVSGSTPKRPEQVGTSIKPFLQHRTCQTAKFFFFCGFTITSVHRVV